MESENNKEVEKLIESLQKKLMHQKDAKQFTKNFRELIDTRVTVKHKEWDKARKMLDGALADYIPDKFNSTEEEDELFEKLSKALKIAINSVYGTGAFDSVKPVSPYEYVWTKKD